MYVSLNNTRNTPQKDNTMASATFWDKIAPKYAASPISDMAAYEATLARTRSFLHSDDHMLEIGCGTGGTAINLAGSVRKVTATDISGQMLGIAESKLEDAGVTNLRFLQTEVRKPLADAPFDAICGFSVLHLIEDLPGTLAHLRSQVKPGGFVITKTACLRDMSFAMPALIKVMQLIGKAPFVNVFTADQLEAAFKNAGFELVETGFFGKSKSTRFIVARRK
jgi:ubiquinone/menaquinone biosynthesis C-methylase UbiE